MTIWLVTGFWVIIGCAEAAHLITIFTDKSQHTYNVLCCIFVLAGTVGYMALLFLLRKNGLSGSKKQKAGDMLFDSGEDWGKKTPFLYPCILLLFVVLTALTMVRFAVDYVPVLDDAVYEIAIGNAKSGSIMTVHPFLGQAVDQGMPLRMKIPGLSSLYSCLITISKQSPYIIMCKVIPIIVWACAMLVYKAFAEQIFKDHRNKQWLFMCLVAFVLLVTSGSEGLAGFRLFYAGFSGETIRGVVLLPYALYVSWQKKWMLAVLAVLAEACLVWTTYGIGYCSVVVICMFAVHLWMDRRAKHET